jgi:hypothetical protein
VHPRKKGRFVAHFSEKGRSVVRSRKRVLSSSHSVNNEFCVNSCVVKSLLRIVTMNYLCKKSRSEYVHESAAQSGLFFKETNRSITSPERVVQIEATHIPGKEKQTES